MLTNAFNINDRGEILAKAAPVGFTPNDDADLGHLALLIPCKEDDCHCENNMEPPENLSRKASRPAAVSTATWHSRASLRRPQTKLRRGGLDLRDSIALPNTEEVSSSGVGTC